MSTVDGSSAAVQQWRANWIACHNIVQIISKTIQVSISTKVVVASECMQQNTPLYVQNRLHNREYCIQLERMGDLATFIQ